VIACTPHARAGEGAGTRPLPRPYDRVVPETILTEQRGDVLLITLDRPEKLNAWTTRMGRELKQAIGDANADATIGAIVVTGAGRAFCAGADIGDTFADRDVTASSSGAESAGANVAYEWVELCLRSKPLIAAVNGICIGVGVTQILCFDAILASDKARFGIGFIKIGLVPELAATRFLTHRMGPDPAHATSSPTPGPPDRRSTDRRGTVAASASGPAPGAAGGVAGRAS